MKTMLHLRASASASARPPPGASTGTINAAARITAPAAAETVMESLIEYVRETVRSLSRREADQEVRKLGTWLYNRRRESRQGVLREEYHARLDELRGWDGPGGKKLKEDQQWAAKLETRTAYVLAGNDWSRNGTGENEEERAHGAKRIDEVLPGWVHGRKG